MTIHAHKIARKQAEMDKMIKDLNPLNDLIYMSGYDDLSNEDRKEFAKQNSKIRKLSKIRVVWPLLTHIVCVESRTAWTDHFVFGYSAPW